MNACWIDDLSSCCCLLSGDELYVVGEEQLIAGQFICQVIDKYQDEKGSKHGALGHIAFTVPSLEKWPPNFTLSVLLLETLLPSS